MTERQRPTCRRAPSLSYSEAVRHAGRSGCGTPGSENRSGSSSTGILPARIIERRSAAPGRARALSSARPTSFSARQTSQSVRIRDSDGRHSSTREPPETARPRRIKGQPAPLTLTVKVPVAPEYFPVPPVTTPVSVRMNGKGGVGNLERSAHTVAEVDLKNKRSPVAVMRETATSSTSVNSVPAPATPPGTVQVCPSGANSLTSGQ